MTQDFVFLLRRVSTRGSFIFLLPRLRYWRRSCLLPSSSSSAEVIPLRTLSSSSVDGSFLLRRLRSWCPSCRLGIRWYRLGLQIGDSQVSIQWRPVDSMLRSSGRLG